MKIPCSVCKDPTFCLNVLGECEFHTKDNVEQKESQREPEEFKPTDLDDDMS